MRIHHHCTTCGQAGHNARSCGHHPAPAAVPNVHTCGTQHAHQCRHCRRWVACCKPECVDLVEAYCVGYCGGNLRLQQFTKLARNETSALA